MQNSGIKDINIPLQREIFKTMAKPEFYPQSVTRVEIKETHISKVFLTGDYVYKIKKAINLEFVDYTSLEKRKFYCQQETVLNRRLSNDIYVGIVAITQRNGSYFLDGPGKIVEYAVKMRQLSEQCCMKTLLQEGKMDRRTIEQLALKLSEFYAQADSGELINSFGALETILANCEENFLQLEKFGEGNFNKEMLLAIREATRSFLSREKILFERRVHTGKIRDCHGDLRCGHIYLTNHFQVIDCIEFNERFRYSDIAADLAFLIMDLDFEGMPKIARYLLNCVVRNIEDPDIYIYIDFYKCYRALVRAKVTCLLLGDITLGPSQTKLICSRINQYLKLAYQYAQFFTLPTIWVICGIVASGKSTIARELSGRLSVKILRSDRIRKGLYDLQPDDFTDVPFEEGMYSREASSFTYSKLFDLAQEEIAKGLSVVLDATFSRKEMRGKALRLASNMGANIIFVECTAPEKILKDRLLSREFNVSLSDARVHQFEHFKSRYEPLDDIPKEGHIRIDTQCLVKDNITDILSHYYYLHSNVIKADSEDHL